MNSTLKENLDAKKQYYGLDILKIVLTLLVVAIHINPFSGVAFMNYIRYPLVLVAVPLFFAISAFLFFSKYDRADDKKHVLLKFAKRNLLLYLCWFIVLLPATIIIRGYLSNGLRGGLQFIIDLFIGSTFRSSWFIMALVIGTLLVVLVSKFLGNVGAIVLGALLYVLCLFASGYGNLIPNNPLLWFINKYPTTIYQSFPSGVLFIAIGKLIADKNERISQNLIVWIILTCVSYGLLVVEFWILEANGIQLTYAYYLMTIPFCLLCLILFLRIPVVLNNKVSLAIRKCSTVTYCLHTTLAWALVALLTKANIEAHFAMSLLIYLVVILICLGATFVIDRLTKLKYLSFLKYFY